MLLADSLLTLPLSALSDIYDTLHAPARAPSFTHDEYRRAIAAYWAEPSHWDELVQALSPAERRTLLRLALQERCRIDAFMEELWGLGLLVLHREVNRYEMPDDVRVAVLERLPSLGERAGAAEEAGGDGEAPV